MRRSLSAESTISVDSRFVQRLDWVSGSLEKAVKDASVRSPASFSASSQAWRASMVVLASSGTVTPPICTEAEIGPTLVSIGVERMALPSRLATNSMCSARLGARMMPILFVA